MLKIADFIVEFGGEGSAFRAALDSIKTISHDVLTTVEEKSSHVLHAVAESVGGALGHVGAGIGNIMTRIFNSITSTAKEGFSWIAEHLKSVFSSGPSVSGAGDIVDKTANKYKSLADAVLGVVRSAPAIGKLELTGADILGPFWRVGSPKCRLFPARTRTAKGLRLSGRVLDTNGNAVEGARLDFWQADENGRYHLRGDDFRGWQEVEPGGRWNLDTIKPGDYKISDTEFRCAHIHVVVTAPGFRLLITQLYFADSPHDDTDRWFSDKRCIRFAGDETAGTFDFVLEREE